MTTKKKDKHCTKYGKNNHNTKNHWDKPPQKQAGKLGSGGGLSKKKDGGNRKKGGSSMKGKKPTTGQKQIMDERINVLKIVNIPMTDYSSKSINFSCYIRTWAVADTYIMSHKADYIKYTPFTSPGKTEIANKKKPY